MNFVSKSMNFVLRNDEFCIQHDLIENVKRSPQAVRSGRSAQCPGGNPDNGLHTGAVFH